MVSVGVGVLAMVFTVRGLSTGDLYDARALRAWLWDRKNKREWDGIWGNKEK
jgi:hypothetical protein